MSGHQNSKMSQTEVVAQDEHATQQYVHESIGKSGKHWVFTDFDVSRSPNIFEHTLDYRYAVWQLEKCPTTGTPHWQGYLELAKVYRFSTLRAILGSRIRLFQRKGSRTQARAYCMKNRSRSNPEGRPSEIGEWVVDTQGRRSDIKAATDAIAGGATRNTMYEEHMAVMVKYPRGMGDAIEREERKKRKRIESVEAVIYWGLTGTGKTHRVVTEQGLDDLYLKEPGMGWDAYEGETKVLFDDFNWRDFRITYMLRVLDKYPFRGRRLYGFVHKNWNQVFLTANEDPATWWPEAPRTSKDAFMRRIKAVEHMREVYVEDSELSSAGSVTLGSSDTMSTIKEL